jgi:hypothetical protein
MKFFEARGRYYPVSEIEHMSPGDRDARSGPGFFGKIYLKGGGFDDFGIKVYNSTIDDIVRGGQQCIAAAPGFRLLTFSYHPGEPDPGPYIHSEPVIGWRVTEGGNQPLVVDTDFHEMEDRHAVLDPTGGVFTWERNFPDQQAWIDEMKGAADRSHEAKQAGPN